MPFGDISLKESGVLEVTGEMVFATVNGLRLKGTSLWAEAAPTEIDLAGVTRADSAGLSLLLEWLRMAAKADQALIFNNVPVQMLVIAELSDLGSLISPH